MNPKRMIIALAASAVFGAFCAYGTSTVNIPGFQMTLPYLLTILYGRLLIGVVVGLSQDMRLVGKRLVNAILRGAILGAVVSVVISFYGGALIFMTAGIVYGALTDLLATRFGA